MAREWEAIGLSRMAELLSMRAKYRVIRTPGVTGDCDPKLREAQRWLQGASREGEAERPWARRHAWFNTVVAGLGLLIGAAGLIVAIVALG